VTGGRAVTRTCPIDGAALASRHRSGIEIDECPECRGVWLDRGELEGLIDQRAAGLRYVSVSAAPGATVTGRAGR
jgi:Zn-finger nucleic acid-binding protein